MKILKIKWQRLVYEGDTCPRCRNTGKEIKKAVSNLRKSLNSLGVKVVFDKEELSIKKFKEDPLNSNVIIINNQPLEYWVDGKIGKSECCDVCGPNDCRTITVDGKTYEEIPSDLIIKGGLIAASDIVTNDTNKSCCGSDSESSQSGSCNC